MNKTQDASNIPSGKVETNSGKRTNAKDVKQEVDPNSVKLDGSTTVYEKDVTRAGERRNNPDILKSEIPLTTEQNAAEIRNDQIEKHNK